MWLYTDEGEWSSKMSDTFLHINGVMDWPHGCFSSISKYSQQGSVITQLTIQYYLVIQLSFLIPHFFCRLKYLCIKKLLFRYIITLLLFSSFLFVPMQYPTHSEKNVHYTLMWSILISKGSFLPLHWCSYRLLAYVYQDFQQWIIRTKLM